VVRPPRCPVNRLVVIYGLRADLVQVVLFATPVILHSYLYSVFGSVVCQNNTEAAYRSALNGRDDGS
jgi:hypothetical protein